ncbi:MAG TPA: hypothetical protein VGW12_10435 [Pyrinomonadaceae bacterium]|nr:hypothetical protein [Pyrinomonadaceae bacterium]
MDRTNKFKLRPAMNGDVPYLDIVIDDQPLATYFVGRLGAIPDCVSPLGWSASEQHERGQFRRFLLEEPPDLPNGRNSILVCHLCGDLACGAYSAIFIREGGLIRWNDFGYESTLDFETAEIPIPSSVSAFIFSWEQYEGELRRHLTSRSTGLLDSNSFMAE